MITFEKLAVYSKFNGDEDGWSRAGCPGKEVISDGEWNMIRNLLQELTMLKRNLVSEEYGSKIRKLLEETAADQKTAQALLDLA